MHDWSERKIRLITKYVGGFVNILSRYKVLYYIDGFAGAGLYDDGSTGSSLRIATLASNLDAVNRPYQLLCINIEDDEDNFARLERHTRDIGNIVSNFIGTFNNNIDHILSKIGNKPVIAFLDPFGAKGIEWNAIRRLVSRSSPTDIFIRFDQKTICRLAGFLDSTSKDASAKARLVEDIYGTSDRSLLSSYFRGDSAEERVGSCVTAYMRLLMGEMVKARGQAFSGAYPIESVKYGNKYHLVFATGSDMGLLLMSDLVFGEDRILSADHIAHHNSKKGQLGLFDTGDFSSMDDSRLDLALESDIMNLFAGKTISRKTIRIQTIMNGWFGRIGKPHYTRVLKKMIKKNTARLLSGTAGIEEAKFEILDPSDKDNTQRLHLIAD